MGAFGVALVAFLYLHREPGGSPRLLLLAFRIGAIALLVLLLLDVEVGGEDPARSTPDGGLWILIDPDLSLSVVDPSVGTSLWEDAVARATDDALGGARLALSVPGDAGLEGTDPASLASRSPSHPPGDLVRAVRRIAEAGADSVVVLSSFRKTSGFRETLAAAAPVPVRLERLGDRVANAGIAELDLPSSMPAGEPIEGIVSVFGEGGAAGDTVAVEIRENGQLRQSLAVPLPQPGRVVSAPVRLPAASDSGMVRFTARVRFPTDRFPVDDLRARWMRVGESEGGILLVSLLPDWEPRVLLPVLEAVTGLEGEGYLRVAEDRFLPLAVGDGEGGTVSSDAFRDRLGASELLVIQASPGVGLPDWLEDAVREHPSVLRLLSPGVGGDVEGLEIGPSRSGEWVPEDDLPASPLSPFLSGVPLGGLVPLGSTRLVANPEAGVVALTAGRPTGESGQPVLIFRETTSGRRAVALADGFWRWGSRTGEPRRAYRGLWSGTAGWLLDDPGGSSAGPIRPVTRIQPRGEPLLWQIPSESAGLAVSLVPVHDGGDAPLPGESTGADAVTYRSALTEAGEGTATTPPAAPGVYRFEVTRGGTAAGEVVSSGLVEVEVWAPSLRLPPLDVASERIAAATGLDPAAAAAGRPLRTHPLPYLVLLGFLCAEWLGRRKLGLQ